MCGGLGPHECAREQGLRSIEIATSTLDLGDIYKTAETVGRDLYEAPIDILTDADLAGVEVSSDMCVICDAILEGMVIVACERELACSQLSIQSIGQSGCSERDYVITPGFATQLVDIAARLVGATVKPIDQ